MTPSVAGALVGAGTVVAVLAGGPTARRASGAFLCGLALVSVAGTAAVVHSGRDGRALGLSDGS